MTPPQELAQLKSVVQGVARQHRLEACNVGLGFELLDELETWDYHCTPVNGVTFGATGGDGVHFNLLTSGGGAGAVVLTAPVGDVPNVIVGASFAEFLRLGYYSCFGWLEELAFAESSAAALYRDEPRRLSKAGILLRDRLRDAFRLVPIDNVTDHLERLQEQYLPGLALPFVPL